MSRQLDFEKPLSDDDRQYALDRGLISEVENNVARFRNVDGQGEETTSPSNYTDTGQTFSVQNKSGLNGNEPSSTADRTSVSGLGLAALDVNRNQPVGDGAAVDVALVDESAGEPGKYDEWTVAELQQELESRELSKSGNKAELVARLTADDKEEGA